MEAIMPWLPSIVWGVLLIIFVIAEAMTAAIVSIWFVAGSLVALVVALLGGPVWVQIILALGVSLGLLAGCRKMIPNGKNAQKLEAEMSPESIIGKTGYVSEDIVPGKTGLVKIDGIQWTARTINHDEHLPENTRIVVCHQEGIICIVEKTEL